ncbi:MAG: hypothetical protein AB7M12_11665 [Hyphomonadaceae bacterium]
MPPTRDDLNAAAEAGLITAEQAARVADFLAARVAPPAAALALNDEENLRFIRNFHDVFLAIGIVMLAVGMAVAAITFLSAYGLFREGWKGGAAWLGAALFAACAGAIWALGETFSRRRRLFLPSIALCISFVGFSATTAAFAYAGAVTHGLSAHAFDLEQGGLLVKLLIVLAPLAALAGALSFYHRFKLPFALGFSGALAALTAFAVAWAAAPAQVAALYAPICIVAGVALFAAGMAFDMRDPERQGRLSDNGFWLHLAAAPFLLNGALGLIGGVTGRVPAFGPIFQDGNANAAQAGLTLTVVAALGFLSLLINRRALIVSALVTTGVAVGVLMNAAGLGAGALVASTLLTLGAFVLILGASWRTARRALLAHLPRHGVWGRAFPPEAPE